MHLLTAKKKSISAAELQRQLSHKRYQPIWELLHKLRSVMGKRDDKYTLKGNIELDEGLLNSETLSELAAALKRLPEQMRDIIVLRYYDGKPLTEIADLMNLSYGAVKLRHQNAVLMLRQALSM